MKISKEQLKQIIKEELGESLEESNFLPLYLLRKQQQKRRKGPGASSIEIHKRAIDAKKKTQAQRDKERKDKEERERKEYDRRWRASLSPEDLAAEEEAEAFRQQWLEEELVEIRDYQQPEEGSVEYHIMDAIRMLQGEDDVSGTLHLVIRRLEEALDTLENDPAYNSDFIDDD